jgi:hypothetical protein
MPQTASVLSTVPQSLDYMVETRPRTGFVASANSQVFCRPDCKSAAAAAKITEKNLVRHREAAIKAGRRPCAECRP